MLTQEEKNVLKELVSIEIEEVKRMIQSALKIDKKDLKSHLEILQAISKKLD